MNRVRWISVLTLLAGMASPCLSADSPNVVFILSDDQGYGDLGCYGATDLKTPNLDKLASEGARFTDFYANGPTCTPTRAAFLMGRYQQRIGLDNALVYQEEGRGLEPGGSTIATELQKKGYVTGLSGKWHLGYDEGRTPLDQGFDHFFGLLGGNHHYFKHMDRIGVPDLWRGREKIEDEGYTTDLISEDAIKFIRKNHRKPFFLFISHAAPHFPFQGPKDREKQVEPKKKSWQLGDRESYIAMVEHMDLGIGEVLKELDKQSLRENTLVIFSSDNGGDVHARNTPFSGGKSSIQEGGIRVPCIARWPGKIPAGRIISDPAITMDWSASIRRLSGLEAQAGREDGVDLLPVLKGEVDSLPERSLFWRRKSGPRRKVDNPGRVVRRGVWKLVENSGARGERLLFNLKEDPAEGKNVISGNPELAKQLRVELDQWEADVDSLEKTSDSARTPNIAPKEVKDLLFLKNRAAKIGIDREMGASISHLSWFIYQKNVVNIHDPGRLIQQSYYAGKTLVRTADGQSKNWSPWAWNPIQGGGVGSWAKVQKFEKQGDNTLYSETIPKLWDMEDEDAEAVMRQWTSFELDMPNAIVVKCELECRRKPGDRWGPALVRHQEMPALYFTRNFSKFRTYLGEGKWRDEKQSPGPPWGKATPPKNVMACFNSKGEGIAVFSPAATEHWNFGPHGGGNSSEAGDAPCVHMAPIAKVKLGPQSTLNYRYWMIVGNEENITTGLDALLKKYSGERLELTNP